MDKDLEAFMELPLHLMESASSDNYEKQSDSVKRQVLIQSYIVMKKGA